MPVTTRSGGGAVAPSPSQKSPRKRVITNAENNNNVELKTSAENNNSRVEPARKRTNDAVKRTESPNPSASTAISIAKASPRGKAGLKTAGATKTALKSNDEKSSDNGSTPKSNRKYPTRSANGKGPHDSDDDDFCSSSLAKRGKKLIIERQNDQPVETRRLRSVAIEKLKDDDNCKDSSTTSNDIEVNLPVTPSAHTKKRIFVEEATSVVASPKSSGMKKRAKAVSIEKVTCPANNEQCEEPTSPDSRSSSPRFHLWPPVNA